MEWELLPQRRRTARECGGRKLCRIQIDFVAGRLPYKSGSRPDLMYCRQAAPQRFFSYEGNVCNLLQIYWENLFLCGIMCAEVLPLRKSNLKARPKGLASRFAGAVRRLLPPKGGAQRFCHCASRISKQGQGPRFKIRRSGKAR